MPWPIFGRRIRWCRGPLGIEHCSSVSVQSASGAGWCGRQPDGRGAVVDQGCRARDIPAVLPCLGDGVERRDIEPGSAFAWDPGAEQRLSVELLMPACGTGIVDYDGSGAGCWALTVQSFKNCRCRRCCTALSTPREMSRMPGTPHWG